MSSAEYFLKQHSKIIFFVLFFLISFGLGYATLNRYDPSQMGYVSDSTFYIHMVKNGITEFGTDPRYTRIVIPFLSHLIYMAVVHHTGHWDPAIFSMLLINSLICALTAILIMASAENLALPRTTGLIASCLFLLNFAVSQFYLAALVDPGECLALLLLYFIANTGRWMWLIPLGVVAVLTKETFLPFSVMFIAGWFSAESKRHILNAKNIFSILFAIVLMGITFTWIRSMANHSLQTPLQYTHVISQATSLNLDRLLEILTRPLYTMGWLLPLALFSLKYCPLTWRRANTLAALTMLILGMMAGVSGAAISRYLFNILGPMLSLAAACTLVSWL